MKKTISRVIEKKPESTEGKKSAVKVKVANKSEDTPKKKRKTAKQDVSWIDEKRQKQGIGSFGSFWCKAPSISSDHLAKIQISGVMV